MISAVGVLGFAGWISIITAKSKYADTLADAALRRIAENNGRRLAAHYAATVVLNHDSGEAITAGIGGYDGSTFVWGGFHMPSWSTNGMLNSMAETAGINRFSPGDRGSYGLAEGERDIMFTVANGISYRLQPKSYSPLLAGDLLNVYARPDGSTPRIEGYFNVEGRTYFHKRPANPPEDFITTHAFVYEAGESIPADYHTTTNSNLPSLATRAWALPPTAAFPPLPLRSQVIWTPGWNINSYPPDGFTLVNKVFAGRHPNFWSEYIIDGGSSNSSNPAYTSTGINESGEESQRYRVKIDLTQEQCGVIVVKNARYLEITGLENNAADPNDEWQTVLIVVRAFEPGLERLQRIELKNNNIRRVVLALSAESWGDPSTSVELVFTEPSTQQWRLALFSEGTPLKFSFDNEASSVSNIILTGGIAVNDDLIVSPNSAFSVITLKRDLAAEKLVQRLPRRQWVEVIRNIFE